MKQRFLGRILQNWYRAIIRHPKYRWAIILATLFYFVSPFDISPDMIPIVGWLDDGLLATLLVTEVSQLLVERSRARKGKAASPEASAEPKQMKLV